MHIFCTWRQNIENSKKGKKCIVIYVIMGMSNQAKENEGDNEEIVFAYCVRFYGIRYADHGGKSADFC